MVLFLEWRQTTCISLFLGENKEEENPYCSKKFQNLIRRKSRPTFNRLRPALPILGGGDLVRVGTRFLLSINYLDFLEYPKSFGIYRQSTHHECRSDCPS